MGNWGYFTPISGVRILITGRDPPCTIVYNSDAFMNQNRSSVSSISCINFTQTGKLGNGLLSQVAVLYMCHGQKSLNIENGHPSFTKETTYKNYINPYRIGLMTIPHYMEIMGVDRPDRTYKSPWRRPVPENLSPLVRHGPSRKVWPNRGSFGRLGQLSSDQNPDMTFHKILVG